MLRAMQNQPDLIARLVAFVVVGGLTGFVATKLFGPKAGAAVGLLASGAHEKFDAPVAVWLGQQGL